MRRQQCLLFASMLLALGGHLSVAASTVARAARHLQTTDSFRRQAGGSRTTIPDPETVCRTISPPPKSRPGGLKVKKLRTKSDQTEMAQFKLQGRAIADPTLTSTNPIRELLAPWLACFGVERRVMTRMVDNERREATDLAGTSIQSFARKVNARTRRLSTLSRSAFFKPDLSTRDGEIRESSFNSHWSKSEAYIMLKALKERPPRPAVVRRRRWRPGDKPPGLHAVPEAVPGQPVVAGAVMSGHQGLEMVKEEENSDLLHKRLDVLCLLDLDMTCFWGNDANDLGCAMQWMGQPKHLLKQLYSIIYNPHCDAALRDLHRTHNTEVVIYTMRCALLNYKSPFRRLTLSLRWDPGWHFDDVTVVDNEAVPQQVLCIPGDVRTAADILETYSGVEELLDRERADLGFCFERLLAARDVLKERLGLRSTPQVLVTTTIKDVVYAARCVGHVGENARAFLWDDNEKLWNRRNVLPVDKYDALPEPAFTELHRFLNKHLPADELDPGLVRFLQGAPEATRILEEVWGEEKAVASGKHSQGSVGSSKAKGHGGGEKAPSWLEAAADSSRLQYVIPRASRVAPTWSLPSLPGIKDLRSGLLSLRTWSKTLMRMGSEVDAIVRRAYSSSSFAAKHDLALVPLHA